MANGIMSLLFGKKKKSTKSVKSSSGTTKKRIGYCIKNKRIVNVYKFKGVSGKRLSNKTKLSKGKKVYKTKAAAKSALKKMTKKASKTHRRRKSAFGIGGSYMPLSSFMAPYPYSVDSSPPWV